MIYSFPRKWGRIPVMLLGMAAFGISETFGQTSADSTAWHRLDEVVVSANRVEQKQSSTSKVVSVISEALLKQYTNLSVGEVLAKEVGFMIVGSQGVTGTNQEVYLRGASAGNTLVLLDGVPIYDASMIAPTFDLNHLLVSAIERIEVVKSSQSALYGSDAVAGVINIFTKKTNGRSAMLQAGSFGTFQASGGFQNHLNNIGYGLRVGTLQTKGFSAATDQLGTQGFDHDGYQQYSILGNIGGNLTSKISLNNYFLYNLYRNDLDAGAFTDEKDFTGRNTFTQFSSRLKYGLDKLSWHLNYAYSASKRVYEDDSTFINKDAFSNYSLANYRANSHFLDLYANFFPNQRMNIIVGADARMSLSDQSYFSLSQWGRYDAKPLGKDTTHTQLMSVYGSLVWKPVEKLTTEMGARLNRHSLYGTNTTVSFNPSYMIFEQLKIFGNFSTSFKTPSLYQLFSVYGNKSLSPEKSKSWETGLRYYSRKKTANIGFTYFQRNIQDIIIFQSLIKEPYGMYVNMDKQHDAGIELDGKMEIEKISLWANLSILRGKITTMQDNKETELPHLIRRPTEMANIGVSYSLRKNTFFMGNLRYAGKRYDSFYNPTTYASEFVTLKPYTLVDFTFGQKLANRLQLIIDLKNIFNQKFTEVYGYNTRGFNFAIGLKYE